MLNGVKNKQTILLFSIAFSTPVIASGSYNGLVELFYGSGESQKPAPTAQAKKITTQPTADVFPPWIDQRKVEIQQDGYFIVDQGVNQQTKPTFMQFGSDLLIDESLFISNQ